MVVTGAAVPHTATDRQHLRHMARCHLCVDDGDTVVACTITQRTCAADGEARGTGKVRVNAVPFSHHDAIHGNV